MNLVAVDPLQPVATGDNRPRSDGGHRHKSAKADLSERLFSIVSLTGGDLTLVSV